MAKPQVALGTPLTAEQVSGVREVRDRWMEIGLSTERCDRPAAERAVRAAYRAAGIPDPRLVVWMDSPLGGVFAAAAIKDLLSSRGQLGDQLWGQLRGQLWGQLGDQLGDQLWGQLRGQLGDQLWDQLGDQLWGQLRGQLGDQLWGQLWGQLGDQLGDQLRGQLGDQLGDQLRGQLGDQLGDQLWGQLWGQLGDQLGDQLRDQLRDQLWGQLGDQLGDQLWDQLRGQLGDQLGDQLRGQLWREVSLWSDCYWMAYLMCALPLAGLDTSGHLDAVAEVCRQAGWWWPMQGVVVLTDRPTVLRRDDTGRLHSESGPALAYADGYRLHSWRGLTVPEWVIEAPSIERALSERNTEIRRAACEVITWPKILDHLGEEPIDVCQDFANAANKLALYRIPDRINPYGRRVNLLLMTNASPDLDGRIRRYGETVPATILRADEAAAWQSDVPVDVYRTLARCT